MKIGLTRRSDDRVRELGDASVPWPAETVFVVYCWGPQCNGANKAALRLARLGRPVKEMIGGVAGWTDEGFPFATGDKPGSLRRENWLQAGKPRAPVDEGL